MDPLKLKLTMSKSTKGTHVYDMKDEAGRSIGSVYLPKLVLPADAPKDLEMVVTKAAGQ